MEETARTAWETPMIEVQEEIKVDLEDGVYVDGPSPGDAGYSGSPA